MKLFLKSNFQKIYEIEVEPTMAISEIKEAIKKQGSLYFIKIYKIDDIKKAVLLEDNQTVESYHLSEDSKLFVLTSCGLR